MLHRINATETEDVCEQLDDSVEKWGELLS